jgi:hypothetical protein
MIVQCAGRRDTVMNPLEGLPFGTPDGGWSLLLRVSDFGIDGEAMSRRLLDHGVGATAMTGWGRDARRAIHPLRLLQRAGSTS